MPELCFVRRILVSKASSEINGYSIDRGIRKLADLYRSSRLINPEKTPTVLYPECLNRGEQAYEIIFPEGHLVKKIFSTKLAQRYKNFKGSRLSRRRRENLQRFYKEAIDFLTSDKVDEAIGSDGSLVLRFKLD